MFPVFPSCCRLGDFALLLQEGLSIKRGLCLNALSSVVCLIGVALGVGLGSIPMFNQFIFSVAAGMFLYVSLVTMVSPCSFNPVFIDIATGNGKVWSGSGEKSRRRWAGQSM